MKKCICALILGLCIIGICAAEEEQYNIWKGTVRFNPADNFINLHNALPGLYITWTQYLIPSLPNLGIPAQMDINFGWGVLPGVQVSLLSGVEYILFGQAGKDKSGLFLDTKIGLSLFFNEDTKAYFVTKSNIGYQFIRKKWLVATPGVGVVYNGRSGFGLNLMFDLGFAYK